jgi:hypothetical protein
MWLLVLMLDCKDPNDACSSPSPDNDSRLDQPKCEPPLPVVILLGIVGGLRRSRLRQQSVGPVDYPLIRSSSELGKNGALSSDPESCGDGVVNHTLGGCKGLIVTENGTSLLELQKHERVLLMVPLSRYLTIYAPI